MTILKRNTQQIPTRLGGGNHGYLALLLYDAKYNGVTGTAPFNHPSDPGVFTPTNITVPATTTRPTTRATATATTATATAITCPPNSAELVQQKAVYDEDLRLYLEVRTVETLL